MIRLYTSSSYFKADETIIDNEAFFNNNVSAKYLTDSSLMVMSDIDKAKLIDRKTGKIETPYGITSIRDLSTGCKTILNCIFIHENPERYPTVKAINATECGWNAIDRLFEYIESIDIFDIAIIIEHDNDLYKCKDREYLVNNDKHIKSMLEFF